MGTFTLISKLHREFFAFSATCWSTKNQISTEIPTFLEICSDALQSETSKFSHMIQNFKPDAPKYGNFEHIHGSATLNHHYQPNTQRFRLGFKKVIDNRGYAVSIGAFQESRELMLVTGLTK